jgi:hypothetical protein
MGLSVVGSAYSRVALEAALDEVGLVFVTRVRLRSWYGIAEWFKWVKLDPSVELMARRRPRWLVIPGGRAHIYNSWEGTACHSPVQPVPC